MRSLYSKDLRHAKTQLKTKVNGDTDEKGAQLKIN